nr:unnamed protein product [Callosobruchus chinensis]
MDSLPEGWEKWEVALWTKEALFGDDLDPQILNKLRFSLPTVGLAKAFDPDIVNLPERVYRNYKVKMLEWPFCIGLFIGPPALAAKMRGSSLKCDLILSELEEVRHLLVSRKQACRQLLDCSSDQASDEEEPAHKIRKRISRLDRLEKSQMEMKHMLQNLISSAGNQEIESGDESLNYRGVDISQSDDDGEPEDLFTDAASTWKAPSLTEPVEEEEFDFTPRTREQDPPIPPPTKKIELQGIEYQRLVSLSFSKVRYADVQKKLQAVPVFSALKLKTELANLAPTGSFNESQVRSDTTLACITHGLLLQREALAKSVCELEVKYLEAASDLKKSFLSQGSDVRILSDDLLQYICGRRAEIIDMRRKLIKPRNAYVSTLLDQIPPSSTHLFDEEKLATLYQQYNDSFRGSGRARSQVVPSYSTATNFGQGQRKNRFRANKDRFFPKTGTSKRGPKSGDGGAKAARSFRKQPERQGKSAGSRNSKKQ